MRDDDDDDDVVVVVVVVVTWQQRQGNRRVDVMAVVSRIGGGTYRSMRATSQGCDIVLKEMHYIAAVVIKQLTYLEKARSCVVDRGWPRQRQ
jgi:hypothetical protein